MKKFLKILSLSSVLAGSVLSSTAYNSGTNHHLQTSKVDVTFDKNNLSTYGDAEKKLLSSGYFYDLDEFYQNYIRVDHKLPTWNAFDVIIGDQQLQYTFFWLNPEINVYSSVDFPLVNVSYSYTPNPRKDELMSDVFKAGLTITVTGTHAPIHGSLTFEVKGDITFGELFNSKDI